MSNPFANDMVDFTWREFAMCKNSSTESFFPYKVTKANAEQVQEVFDMCSQCPVKEECFYEAVKNDYHGIWAGTFYKERLSWIRMMNLNEEEITYESCSDFIKVNSNRRVTSKIGTVDV